MNRRTLLKQTGAAASALFAGSSILGKLTPRALAQAPVQPPISLATTLSSSAPFVLPPLPYNYDALEPFIDAETMHLHHDKHHASYVEKLNAVVASDASLSHHSLKSLLANLSSIPEPVRTSVRNQAGGHPHRRGSRDFVDAHGDGVCDGSPRCNFGDSRSTHDATTGGSARRCRSCA